MIGPRSPHHVVSYPELNAAEPSHYVNGVFQEKALHQQTHESVSRPVQICTKNRLDNNTCEPSRVLLKNHLALSAC
jgi:hypothetical protein